MMKLSSLVLVTALVAVCSSCATKETYADTRREMDGQDDVIRELRRKNEELSSRTTVLTTEVETLRAENGALQSRLGAASNYNDVSAKLKQVEEEMRRREAEAINNTMNSGIGSGLGAGVSSKPHEDGVAIEVAETMLFQAGRAELRPEGRQVLKTLAGRMINAGHKIRVEGHTDASPVRATRAQYPMGNLELSGKRALVVAHFLTTEGGVPADRVSFAGYGKHRPIASNTSEADMARNRRVEIVLIHGAGETGR